MKYILHPLDVHAVREESQYVPGDFLIHFAGKAEAYKRELMRYYLDQALEAEDQPQTGRALRALRGTGVEGA